MKMMTMLIKDAVESSTYGLSALRTLILTGNGYTARPTGVKLYPTLAAAVTVTGAAGAFTLGAAATLAALNAITSAFQITGVQVDAVGGAQKSELVIYDDGTEILRIPFAAVGFYPVLACPLIAANSAITAKLASAAGGSQTADVRFQYRY